MKLLIAGSRTVTRIDIPDLLSKYHLRPKEIVTGCAPGVDSLAYRWAKGSGIAVTVFHAAWGYAGKSAGPERNARMAEYADCLLAVWDGKSRGTENMIEQMRSRDKTTHVEMTGEPPIKPLCTCGGLPVVWTVHDNYLVRCTRCNFEVDDHARTPEGAMTQWAIRIERKRETEHLR